MLLGAVAVNGGSVSFGPMSAERITTSTSQQYNYFAFLRHFVLVPIPKLQLLTVVTNNPHLCNAV